MEKFIEGDFVKYINNTGAVTLQDDSEIVLKAETFVHYTYVKSSKKLMVLDIQGAGYNVCDPEVSSANLKADDEDQILFCSGNLSTSVIDTFISSHICNQFCKQLKLDDSL